MSKNYWEKLKDPRWQKKRLEILNRSDFTCEKCGDKKETLHVHHGYYEKDLEPWEYENRYLWVLCDFCHTIEHRSKLNINKMIAEIPPSLSLDIYESIKSLLENTSPEYMAYGIKRAREFKCVMNSI